jgi:hypothetical protein
VTITVLSESLIRTLLANVTRLRLRPSDSQGTRNISVEHLNLSLSLGRRLLDGRGADAGAETTIPLPEADVYLMGHILHDWGQPEKQALLRRVYEALPDGGALIVYDAVIDDERSTNAFGLLMSLNMLIETPAGADYTGADCQAWMSAAGFRESYVKPLVGPDSMVVGLK